MQPIPLITAVIMAVAFIPSSIGAQTSDSCSKLAELKIPGASLEITRAENVPAAPMPKNPTGAVYTGIIPANCRVDGVPDSRTGINNKSYGIGFAFALPNDWNGRFLFQGGGGLNGTVQAPMGAQASGDAPFHCEGAKNAGER